MTDPEYVVTVAGEGGTSPDRRLHTDADCQHIRESETIPATRADHPDKKVCARCSGAYRQGEEDWASYCALRDADPDDLVTDGGRDTATTGPARSVSVGDECPDCGREITETTAGGLLAFCWWCTDRSGDTNTARQGGVDDGE